MLSIHHFLGERNITRQEQTSNSPDLAPCDFFLFLKLKRIIKEKPFKMTALRGIPEESFQQCIEAWQRKSGKGIKLKRDNFEGETK